MDSTFQGYYNLKVKTRLVLTTSPKCIELDHKKLQANIQMLLCKCRTQVSRISCTKTLQDQSHLTVSKDLISGVQRLIVAYQAAPGLNRLNRPNSLSFLFTEIMNDGAFRGTLRGLSLSLAQASFVLWPSVLLTNKTNGTPYHFVGTYLALDALLYPLDTIKNIMYANTAVPHNLREAFSEIGLYRGFLYKLAFNVPFAGALYTTATGCDTSWAFWLATLVAYPLNTLKVLRQTSNKTNISQYGLYRGVVPFALLNIAFSWKLTALLSAQTLQNIGQQAILERHQKLGF